MTHRIVAPGKLVLLGEYAVLDGAPAIVAAVNRGVRCDVSEADATTWSTPGDDRFVAAALAAAHAPPGHYAFADHDPPATQTKPGLGGSAAAVVAAIWAAEVRRGGSPDPDRLHALARRVHHQVQGSGSGIDIAASTYGGVLRFQDGTASALDVGLDPVVVWSGRSAKTGPRVQRYRSLAEPARRRFVTAMTEAVAGFAADPVAATRAGWRALCAMASAADLPYRTPTLDRIVELAETYGGAGKPSGAGGGDCAVALFSRDDDRKAFLGACQAHDLPIVAIQVATGVTETTG